MSVWDAFTGKKSSKRSTETVTAEPTTTFSSSPYASTTIEDASSFLDSASLQDASKLHPLAGLNQQTLDYLTLDESTLSDLPGSKSALPSRGWSDDLCYGTGVTYLTALSIGGTWGLIEGLNRAPAAAPPKLRLNSVLNSVTKRGPFLGNSAGVMAMVYNGVNSILGHYRGKHDSANSIVAGALSGMLFKSTRGFKPMVISGGIVASVAGAWAVRGPPLILSAISTDAFVARSPAKSSFSQIQYPLIADSDFSWMHLTLSTRYHHSEAPRRAQQLHKVCNGVCPSLVTPDACPRRGEREQLRLRSRAHDVFQQQSRSSQISLNS
jgi:mitochondrial import inner membrane translocase subunit TIM23